jgi:hypothetical protein
MTGMTPPKLGRGGARTADGKTLHGSCLVAERCTDSRSPGGRIAT